MYPVSAGFLKALSTSKRIAIAADVDKAGRRLFTGLPVLGGNVKVSTTAIARRQLTLELAPRLRYSDYVDAPTLPATPADPLGHYGQEISVRWGLVYPDDTIEWVPVFRGRIEQVGGPLIGAGSVTVTALSHEVTIADAKFVAPRTLTSPSTQSLIGQLIHEVMGSVEVVARATIDARVPTMSVDRDRWGTITALAESIGAVVYCDALGRFVIADAPTTTEGVPVWRVTSGPGGVLVDAKTTSSRSDVINGWVVIGQSPSGDFAPMQAVITDDSASSPTRWGDPATGAFGYAPDFATYPNISTLEQARAVGRGHLARSTGAAQSLQLSTVPNAALEGYDLIHVVTDPGTPQMVVRSHIIDTLSIPLTPGGAFPITTREVGAP